MIGSGMLPRVLLVNFFGLEWGPDLSAVPRLG